MRRRQRKFSIVKFRHKANGTVTTEEFGIPTNINSSEPWIAEAPEGDWYYAPGFTYDSGMMIHYIIEAIARDGNAALCISLLPDGSLDECSRKMLQEVRMWMRKNREAVYGSRSRVIPGEGENHRFLYDPKAVTYFVMPSKVEADFVILDLQVESIEVHDLDPSRDKILDEFFLSIGTRIYFCDGPKLRMRTEYEVNPCCSPLLFA